MMSPRQQLCYDILCRVSAEEMWWGIIAQDDLRELAEELGDIPPDEVWTDTVTEVLSLAGFGHESWDDLRNNIRNSLSQFDIEARLAD